MNLNVHPIFVHFPIAMLVVYSIIKILPMRRFFPNVSWREIENALLVVGVFGSFAAIFTGLIAKGIVKPREELVKMHELFAISTATIYSVLLISEALYFFKKNQRVNSIYRIVTAPTISRILAILGLIAVVTTGLLGGVIVYGTSMDPLAPFVLRLLGI